MKNIQVLKLKKRLTYNNDVPFRFGKKNYWIKLKDRKDYYQELKQRILLKKEIFRVSDGLYNERRRNKYDETT